MLQLISNQPICLPLGQISDLSNLGPLASLCSLDDLVVALVVWDIQVILLGYGWWKEPMPVNMLHMIVYLQELDLPSANEMSTFKIFDQRLSCRQADKGFRIIICAWTRLGWTIFNIP